MDQEYPFRPRGKHGFDRNDVINYISQAQLRCNEHLAQLEELEAAKSAWYTQAKALEREKATLVTRNRELEEQLERVVVAPEAQGGEWLPQGEDGAAAAADAEITALKARCLELDQELGAQKELLSQRDKALDEQKSRMAELERDNDSMQQELDALPRFSMDKQEIESLRAQLDQQISQNRGAASRAAELEQQNAALQEQVKELEADKAAYAGQMPALQQQLDQLSASTEQIAALEAAKAAAAAELEAVKAQLENATQEQLNKLAASAEQIAGLETAKAAIAAELEAAKAERESASAAYYALKSEHEAAQQTLAARDEALAALGAAENQAQQQVEERNAEIELLRARIDEMEQEKHNAANKEDTLRSMVLSSFNYANLYVDNNLKTAQLISEATSRNIGHVSDSAASLMEQVEAISRSFGDTTDHIRRNLGAFQQELAAIQAGMNRRLAKDRFKNLLEENDKLRESLESELIAELRAEEDEMPAVRYEAPPNQGEQPQALPFAEDLPPSFHAFLDEQQALHITHGGALPRRINYHPMIDIPGILWHTIT